MEKFLQYYGLDWIGMALALFSVYLLGKKQAIGFITFAIANSVWVFLGFGWMESLGVAVGNGIHFFMNIWGYLSWKKDGAINTA